MRSRGFSLVEMILTISIVSFLLSIATLRFQGYLKQRRTEAQTRLIYAELLKARTNAIYQRRGTRVKFYPNRFEVYSSQQDGTSVRPVSTYLLSYPITATASGGFDLSVGGDIDFDEKGVTEDWNSICAEGGRSGVVDSIVIHYLRTTIGRKDKGETCETASITPQ